MTCQYNVNATLLQKSSRDTLAIKVKSVCLVMVTSHDFHQNIANYLIED